MLNFKKIGGSSDPINSYSEKLSMIVNSVVTTATLKISSPRLLPQIFIGELPFSGSSKQLQLLAIVSPPLAWVSSSCTQEKRRLPKTIILQKSVYTTADCLKSYLSGTLRNSIVIIPFLEKRLSNKIVSRRYKGFHGDENSMIYTKTIRNPGITYII